MDLLWENASPVSIFAAQTIQLHGSNYTHYVIIPVANNGDLRRGAAVIVDIGKSGIISMAEGYEGCTSGSLACFTRTFSTSIEKVSFGDGASVKAGSSYSTSNSYAFPAQIFGIKIGSIS